MNARVFLHYSQAELDRNYDQQASAPNAPDIIAGYSRKSAEARANYRYETYNYGSHPDQTLDFFPANESSHRSTVIFIHGGAWRIQTKDDYSFVANAFVPNSANCIVLNFSKLPGVRLPEVVLQLQHALTWMLENSTKLRINQDRLYLCGHSSGAHLAATLLVTDWRNVGLQEPPVRGATLVSGSYDLKPVLLSSRRSYIFLSSREEHELSPVRHVHSRMPSVLVAYAERDTDEFRRHAQEFASAARQAGRLAELVSIKGINHFEIAALLGEADNDLLRRILTHVEASNSGYSWSK